MNSSEYISNIVRMAMQAGLGAYLVAHGVADTNAFATLLCLVLTGVWSIYDKRRALLKEPPKQQTNGEPK